jgi:hypothetical protein
MLKAYDTKCFWLATSETNSHFLSDSIYGMEYLILEFTPTSHGVSDLIQK